MLISLLCQGNNILSLVINPGYIVLRFLTKETSCASKEKNPCFVQIDTKLTKYPTSCKIRVNEKYRVYSCGKSTQYRLLLSQNMTKTRDSGHQSYVAISSLKSLKNSYAVLGSSLRWSRSACRWNPSLACMTTSTRRCTTWISPCMWFSRQP